jgi:hypothetical protein
VVKERSVNFFDRIDLSFAPTPHHLTRQPSKTMSNPLTNYSITPSLTVSHPTASQAIPSSEELTQHYLLSLRLIDSILENDKVLTERLVLEEKVDCWISDELSTQGWTSLHAAACKSTLPFTPFFSSVCVMS